MMVVLKWFEREMTTASTLRKPKFIVTISTCLGLALLLIIIKLVIVGAIGDLRDIHLAQVNPSKVFYYCLIIPLFEETMAKLWLKPLKSNLIASICCWPIYTVIVMTNMNVLYLASVALFFSLIALILVKAVNQDELNRFFDKHYIVLLITSVTISLVILIIPFVTFTFSLLFFALMFALLNAIIVIVIRLRFGFAWAVIVQSAVSVLTLFSY